VNLPRAQTVIKVRRVSPASKTREPEISHYVASRPIDTRTPEQRLSLIRGHWGGIEIRNHWRKDACLLEDRTRRRNPSLAGAMALLRNVLLFFFNDQRIRSTPAGFTEAVAADASRAYSMIKGRS